jgi:hypothetical protein
MFSLFKSFVPGHNAHEGTGSGSHFGGVLQSQGSTLCCSHGQAAPVITGNSSFEQALSVTIGRRSQGHAANTVVLKEHDAIPTAIAAAKVSFLIVIITSFVNEWRRFSSVSNKLWKF